MNITEENNKPKVARGRIGEDRFVNPGDGGETQILNVEAERNSKVLGREK